jgi:hypothetical protein
MKSSTAEPAFTRRMILLGIFSFDTISSRVWAPKTLFLSLSFARNGRLLLWFYCTRKLWIRCPPYSGSDSEP